MWRNSRAGPARGIALAVAGDAVAWTDDGSPILQPPLVPDTAASAGEFLDVEMEEFTGVSALVATDRQRRFEGRESGGVRVQETGHRSLGELGGVGDLETWEFATAQGQHAGDAQRVDGSWRGWGPRRAIVEARKPFGAEAGEPLEDGAGGDAQSRGDGGHGLRKIPDAVDDLRSTPRSEPGFTVQVHAAVVLGLGLCDNPTFPTPRRMNNLLELHS